MANFQQIEGLLPPSSMTFSGRASAQRMLDERAPWRRLLQGRAFRTLGRAFHASVAVLAFLLFWEVAPRVGLAEPAFLPPLSTVLGSGWALVKNASSGTISRPACRARSWALRSPSATRCRWAWRSAGTGALPTS